MSCKRGAVALLAAILLAHGATGAERILLPDFLINIWDQDEDELPNTRVNSIAYTPDGYVWLATHGGLVRFDGMDFTTFKTNVIPGLQVNQVYRLFTDRAGVLWIGTTVGTLVKRDDNGFSTVAVPRAYTSGHNLNAIIDDNQGGLWLAFAGMGLVRLKGGQMEYFSTTNGLPVTNITQMVADQAGKLWAIGDEKLLGLDQGKWRLVEGAHSPPSIRVIAPANDGGLWVATLGPSTEGAYLFKFKNGQWFRVFDPYPWPQDSPRSRVRTLLEDYNGRLWCGMAGNGVFFHTAAGVWQNLAADTALAQTEVASFEEGRSGIIWIGTRTAGLHQIRPRPVKTLDLPADAKQNVATTVCVTRDGRIWCGTDGAGLYCWHDHDMTHYGFGHGLDNLQVNTLFEDSHTDLCAGTAGGLFRLEGDRFKLVPNDLLVQNPVISLLEDRDGSLWAGTRNGLIHLSGSLSGSDARLFGSDDGLANLPVRALAQDKEGRLWVAIQSSGIFRQNGNGFQRVAGTPPGLLTGLVHQMYCDSDGAIWFATHSTGLFRYAEGQFREWTQDDDGLVNNHCFAILEDDDGNLWFNSEEGIFGISKKRLDNYQRGKTPPLTSWRLNKNDGLAQKVCTGGGQPAAAKSSDGRMWFPDGSSVAVFNPAEVPRNIRTWPPIVQDVLVDDVSFAMTATTNAIHVQSGAVRYEFHYTSPNILSPERLKFRYRLAGLDKGWVEAGNRRVAYYSRLSPGHYQFMVEAAAPDSEWHATTQSLDIDVIPRFYERASVRFAGGVLLLAGVAGVAWRVERNRSRRKWERLKLQRDLDQERQRIARDIHDDLGSGLTEIILLSDNINLASSPIAEKEKMVGEISTRARSLTRAMDEVVWAINPHNDTLESLLTYLNKHAQEYLSGAGIRCRLDLPLELPDLRLTAEARHHLYLACKEALNNIVKHSGATEAWLRLQLDENAFTLSIEDNGRGFDLAAHRSRGNGLHNMCNRLEELKGCCDITSKPNSGTRVKFTISTKNTNFTKPQHTT